MFVVVGLICNEEDISFVLFCVPYYWDYGFANVKFRLPSSKLPEGSFLETRLTKMMVLY